jgi:hypothetical protein
MLINWTGCAFKRYSRRPFFTIVIPQHLQSHSTPVVCPFGMSRSFAAGPSKRTEERFFAMSGKPMMLSFLPRLNLMVNL